MIDHGVGPELSDRGHGVTKRDENDGLQAGGAGRFKVRAAVADHEGAFRRRTQRLHHMGEPRRVWLPGEAGIAPLNDAERLGDAESVQEIAGDSVMVVGAMPAARSASRVSRAPG